MSKLGKSKLWYGWVSACSMQHADLWDWPVAHDTNSDGFLYYNPDYSFYSVTWWCIVLMCWSLKKNNKNKVCCTVFKICLSKSAFTALTFLVNSGAIFILLVYYHYDCDWTRACQEKGVTMKTATTFRQVPNIWTFTTQRKQLLFLLCAFLHDSIYGGLYSLTAFFSTVQKADRETVENNCIINYVYNFSAFWESVLAFSLINLSWKLPVSIVYLLSILLISCSK